MRERLISRHSICFLFALGLFAFCVAMPTSVLAQSQAPKSKEKKKTAVNFEDQLIEGEVNKPEFFYFLQKKQFNFGRLIKLRENFLIEMRKTSEEVERKGGT